jgi:L-lactate dehydrogenase (cytochrome)
MVGDLLTCAFKLHSISLPYFSSILTLHSAPPPMEILRELAATRPDLVRHRNFEIYLDGGVSRGTDVLKALCLGARAIGIGRAFLYANGVWGEVGCDRVIQSA